MTIPRQRWLALLLLISVIGLLAAAPGHAQSACPHVRFVLDSGMPVDQSAVCEAAQPFADEGIELFVYLTDDSPTSEDTWFARLDQVEAEAGIRELASGGFDRNTLALEASTTQTADWATSVTIGIDDWAFRKGRNYGTIIVDHELGKPIDLLPSSAGNDVKEWLEQYPSIEIVTRDRSGEYRDAITQALSEATQIADRWHLLKNMGETIERHISKRYKSLRESMANWAKEDTVDLDTENSEKRRRYAPGPEQEVIHTARTEVRQALYDAVKARRHKGLHH